MSDELLRRATAALRETTAAPNPSSGATRARLLESAHQRHEARRGRVWRWLLALASTLVVSTATARVAVYWPEAWKAIAPALSEAPKTIAAARPRKQRIATSAAAQPTVLPALPAPPSLAPPPLVPQPPEAERPALAQIDDVVAPRGVQVESPAKAKRLRARDTSTADGERSPRAPLAEVAAAAEPVELTLFRRAQRLHLARDPEALIAWDAYLRVSAHGVLAPEAKYNRALCLVRLGRTAEARAALEPFARGELNGYRRAEARALLDAFSGIAPALRGGAMSISR
jgi:hypothetical protein